MPQRIGLHDSTFFHVYNRGADRQDIFTDPGDQAFFERLLADLVAELNVKIHAYALMTNHFHLLIEAIGELLSEAMYRLGRLYAIVYNGSVQRTGPLFDSRFHAVPVMDERARTVEGRYIHRNPQAIVGIDALHAYRFSSLGVYAGHRPNPGWLTTDVLLAPFGNGSSYLDYVKTANVADAQPSGSRPPLHPVSGEDLEIALINTANLDPETLRCSQNGRRNDARLLAVLLTRQLRVEPNRQAAERFGFESEQAYRVAASRAKALFQRDPEFAQFHERVLRALVA